MDADEQAREALVQAGLAPQPAQNPLPGTAPHTHKPTGKNSARDQQRRAPLTHQHTPQLNTPANRGNVTAIDDGTTDDGREVEGRRRDRFGCFVPGPIKPPTADEADLPDELAILGKYPRSWGRLPANASLQAEIAWVQSNRIPILESGKVRLDQAECPAPSMGALAWLETSIRSYAKYVDVCARALATQQDEQESVRRERMACTEIDELLCV